MNKIESDYTGEWKLNVITQVNAIDISDKTQSEIVAYLRCLPVYSDVELIVSRVTSIALSAQVNSNLINN